jgi:hypothetical protein
MKPALLELRIYTLRTNMKENIPAVSQKEILIFWKTVLSIILSKMYMYMCPSPNGFRDKYFTVQFQNC